MRTLDSWLSEYSESHQHPLNQLIHKICVPLIFFSVVGLLIEIPVQLGAIKLGTVVIGIALAWYSLLGFNPRLPGASKAGWLMLFQYLLCRVLLFFLSEVFETRTWIVLVAIFIAAWIGQFYGHKIEGKKPSFFKDLQFLLIGPLWIWKGILFK